MNEDEFDFLLDDPDTLNELTKFDILNRGHKPEVFARSSTTIASHDNVVEEDQPVVHYNKFVKGKKQDFVPEPQKIATVFRDKLFDVSFML